VGSTPTTEQRLMAHVLDLNVHARISHLTAAARYGLPGFAVGPVHVTGDRERGRRPHHRSIIHRPKLLLLHHELVLDGIPMTSPTRTLFDLAAVIHPKAAARAVDTALSMRLTSIPKLQRMLKELARRGRPGIRVMRAILDLRPIGYMPTDSRLELRVEELARRAGITTLERQVEVGNEQERIGRVDFLDRARKIIIEVQSDRHHRSYLDRERDKARIAALRAAGWTVIEILEHDVWYDAEKVIRQLREAFWVNEPAR
jgi:very-short-patch-repair endonuclease